jgi:hypothetical protein
LSPVRYWVCWKCRANTVFNVLLTVRNSNAINASNLIHTSFSLSLLFGFKTSTCFGHHLPIFRRHYTNAVLVSVVCDDRCGLPTSIGKHCLFYLHRRVGMKMEQTECSETSAYKLQAPMNHPEVSIQQIRLSL